ncbi:MAG TPA: hypothetical protein VNG51_01450 [Ktedonobacteraceae bacterium]|nr:hypothetical protein [Ktedonobacteraceae bacterium]
MTIMSTDFFVDWYNQHGRNFPWRQDGVSPFALLVTEMLLRQTQAPAVAKLWHKFIQMYPDARVMAKAKEVELVEQLKILGLGRQRASALIAAATWLMKYHDGRVPDIKAELIKVPHVGMYVSNAVLCFAFGHYIEVVDTNVLRFYARYYGLTVKPDIRRNPEVWKIASSSLPENVKNVKQHNYGLLDFTSEICRSRVPQCNICPLASSCLWAKRGLF